ncbi:transposase [Streptomyces virginiae]|uniref:transposase n=1 Tax=Streptomyces virginiae TaxID=1961 RepID=UPI00364A72D6
MPALLLQLNTACLNADQLVQAAGQAFEEHADAPIIRSFPGLGSLTGARVLAEIGDDRTRCANADSLKAYAASAPATRAGGTSLGLPPQSVRVRAVLADGQVWIDELPFRIIQLRARRAA